MTVHNCLKCFNCLIYFQVSQTVNNLKDSTAGCVSKPYFLVGGLTCYIGKQGKNNWSTFPH